VAAHEDRVPWDLRGTFTTRPEEHEGHEESTEMPLAPLQVREYPECSPEAGTAPYSRACSQQRGGATSFPA
jgi:hypothetical protein